MPPQTLAEAGDAPEWRIAKAARALIAADTWFSDVFKPILLIEAPTERRLAQFSAMTLAVTPGIVVQQGMPSSRVVPGVPVFFIVALPAENVSQDSEGNSTNVMNRLRKLLWSNQELRDAESLLSPDGKTGLTDATIEFAMTDGRVTNSGTFIAIYRVMYQTDINPQTGEFI